MVIILRYAVDGILWKNNKVILIKRAGRTFHGFWALPGGILEEGETVEETLTREMKEEVNMDVKPLAILGVYSHPERDPREHTISVVFICNYDGNPSAGDDAADWQEFLLDELGNIEIAFDHKKILSDLKKWLTKRETFWSSKI
ncbi:MAG: NUDIX hydrolase [Asgard group archaeon]|nr:NUDIX hydrolase [Asgard group archaeon]